MKTIAWQDALEKIQADVKLAEAELKQLIASKIQLVDQVNRHTFEAGGKRLRPAFVILCAKASGWSGDLGRVLRLASCLEMIHMATLIHDDVIDHAANRRGRPTAATVFGNTAAILSGDVLLAKSMSILAADGDLKIIRTVSAAVEEMAQGEAWEVAIRSDYDLPIDDYLKVFRMKTAAFVECCCQVGAMASGSDPTQLGNYGHHLGMAFQIIDDLLDYRGNPDETGKPLATDFREGCMTLPLALLRDRLEGEEGDFVRNRFGANPSDDEIAMICSWMDHRNCFEEAQKIALEHCEKARDALLTLPASQYRDLLEAVVGFVIERDK
ncbi:MAG: polyprenyl synthetase family protein [Chthonomonas sp.]|nr:polyprenyl synthetase family protein [Chthonomonas sp.]